MILRLIYIGAIGEQLIVFDKMDSTSTKKDENEQDSGSQQEKG
jgi:hypothetical protein